MRHIPRKRFGQHFLTDHAVLDAIVRTIDPRPGDAMVEIGPGLGAMTQPLRQALAPGRLTVVELDRDLAARLRRADEVDVVEADVLSVDFGAMAERASSGLRVVGNLPYNISTPILFHLLGHRMAVVDQHFMLQLEVVERMVAAPDSSDYSRLSVMLQAFYAMEQVLDVPPEAFDPPPQVDSAVVSMTPLKEALVAGPVEPVLSELVAAAFSQRRKLLRHTLGAWLEQRGVDASFDLQRRAQEVPVAEYAALATQVALRQRSTTDVPETGC